MRKLDVDKVREMREAGSTLAVIAEQFAVTRSAVNLVTKRLGITFRKTCRNCGTNFTTSRVKKEFCKTACGTRYRSVHWREFVRKETRTCECGNTFEAYTNSGRCHCTACLGKWRRKDERDKKIREQYAAGVSVAQLSQQYGVGPQAIYRVLNRRNEAVRVIRTADRKQVACKNCGEFFTQKYVGAMFHNKPCYDEYRRKRISGRWQD